MDWLIKLLTALFGAWLNKTPPIVPVAKEAGAAEADLATERQANAEAQKAVDAARAADVRDADPSKLRDDDGFERKD